MKSLTDFALNEEYKRVRRLGDKLAKIESLTDRLGSVSSDCWHAVREQERTRREAEHRRGGDGEGARAPAMARALRS
jgi:hypothetical protein